MTAIELILFGKSKINYKDSAALFLFANQKIIRFYISMNKALRVNILNPF